MGRTTRRSGALLVLALVICCLGACGSTSDDGASGSTSADAPVETTTVDTPDPAMFDETLAGLTTRLDEAEGDLCALFGLLEGAGAAGNPTTEPQVRDAFRFLGAVYTKVADATPDELATEAAQIRKSAQDMIAEADDDTLDVATAKQAGPSAYQDKAFLEAMSKYSTVATNCSKDAAADGAG